MTFYRRYRLHVGSVVEYPWSSYRAFVGKEVSPEWLETDYIHGYFGKRVAQAQREYERFVGDKNRLHDPSPLEKASADVILGPESFIQGISKKYLEGRRSDRELPALRALNSRPSFARISSVVDHHVDDHKLARKMKLYLMKRYSGATLKAIGEPFGLGESAVSQVCRRFDVLVKEDKGIRNKLRLCEQLILSDV